MAVGLYRLSASDQRVKLLVRDVIVPSDSDYLERSGCYVSLQPEFLEGCFRVSEDCRCSIVDIHTHPGSEVPSFSPVDDSEARDVKMPYMRQYVPEVDIAYMVFGCGPEAVQARIWDDNSRSWSLMPKILVI
jgi:hypothetical protein